MRSPPDAAVLNRPPGLADFLALAGKVDYLICPGCFARGKCRFGMTLEKLTEPGQSVTTLRCPAEQEGAPGVGHGGWTAAVMDEILGHLALLSGVFIVTKRLTVEFLKPVPLERDLECHAWVESREDGRWKIAGELRLGASVLAKAAGLFVERDLSHFQRFDRWMAEQAADRPKA